MGLEEYYHYQKKSGMTTKDILDKAGLSRSFISEWKKRAAFYAPSIEALKLIAEALECPWEELDKGLVHKPGGHRKPGKSNKKTEERTAKNLEIEKAITENQKQESEYEEILNTVVAGLTMREWYELSPREWFRKKDTLSPVEASWLTYMCEKAFPYRYPFKGYEHIHKNDLLRLVGGIYKTFVDDINPYLWSKEVDPDVHYKFEENRFIKGKHVVKYRPKAWVVMEAEYNKLIGWMLDLGLSAVIREAKRIAKDTVRKAKIKRKEWIEKHGTDNTTDFMG